MDAKKNQKKKGNQNKHTEDAASIANSEEISIYDTGNGFGLEDNHSTKSVQDPGSSSALIDNHYTNNYTRSDVPSVDVLESDMEQDKHKPNDTNSINIQEEVRQLKDEGNIWRQKQAGLKDKVEVLLKELNMYAQKGAILEEKLKYFQNGNDSLIQKQAFLEDKVNTIDGIKET